MTAQCLSNLRQLQAAWQMYADDFDGTCVPNKSHRTNGVFRGYPETWAGENNAAVDTTDELLANGLLVRLRLIEGTGVFRCPADRSTAQGYPRTRSYGLSAHFAGRTSAGPHVIFRVSETKNPAQAFVFIDELEETIDDGHFLVWHAPDNRWTNMPADRHGRGAALSFADGHVEHWLWKSKKNFLQKTGRDWMDAVDDLLDLRRLQSALPEHL